MQLKSRIASKILKRIKLKVKRKQGGEGKLAGGNDDIREAKVNSNKF